MGLPTPSRLCAARPPLARDGPSLGFPPGLAGCSPCRGDCLRAADFPGAGRVAHWPTTKRGSKGTKRASFHYVYAVPLCPMRCKDRKVRFMKPCLYVAAFALVFSGLVAPASAKGCIKGAVVGGAAGHYAGHHGVIGAVAGCIVGRHQAHKHARNYDHSAVDDSNR